MAPGQLHLGALGQALLPFAIGHGDGRAPGGAPVAGLGPAPASDMEPMEGDGALLEMLGSGSGHPGASDLDAPFNIELMLKEETEAEDEGHGPGALAAACGVSFSPVIARRAPTCSGRPAS